MERKDLAKKSLVATAAASSFAVAAWLSFSQSGLPMPKASVMEHSPNPFSTSRGGTDGRTDTGSDAMREKPAPTEPERMRLNSAPPVEAYFFEERF